MPIKGRLGSGGKSVINGDFIASFKLMFTGCGILVAPAGTSIICPALVEPDLAARISDVALQAFRALGGRGYGRVDIRLDEYSVPCVLEVNCNPCLDDGMGLARSALAAGISFPQLLQLIIRAALEPQPFDLAIPMLPMTARHAKAAAN